MADTEDKGQLCPVSVFGLFAGGFTPPVGTSAPTLSTALLGGLGGSRPGAMPGEGRVGYQPLSRMRG